MQKTSGYKKFAAFMVALALAVGAFGTVGAHAVHAESGSSHSSSLSSADSETVIRLLEDLIKLLTQRLDALLKDRGMSMDDSSDEDEECDDSSDDTGLTELEATVYTNETLVKVEIDGDKDILVTDADTRAEIIDAILDEYSSLSEDEVDDMLTVEDEDRASRTKDKDWADDEKDSSCDDEEEDESEDDDDGRHGHGSDDDEDEDEDEDD